MLPLPCSIPNRNTAHSELPRFQPAPQLKPSNTAAPLYPALPTPNSEEAFFPWRIKPFSRKLVRKPPRIRARSLPSSDTVPGVAVIHRGGSIPKRSLLHNRRALDVLSILMAGGVRGVKQSHHDAPSGGLDGRRAKRLDCLLTLILTGISAKRCPPRSPKRRYFPALVLLGGTPVSDPPFFLRFLNRLLGVNSCRREEANPK